MPYNKKAIQRAKSEGILDNGVFDAKALELDREEKEKLKTELQRVQSQLASSSTQDEPSESPKREEKIFSSVVQLALWDRIVLFFLALLGVQMQESYLQYKALRQVYKDLATIRPAIYNHKTRMVTRYFAYRVLDLQMKLLFFKPIFEMIETPRWDTLEEKKTGIEYLCETLMNVDQEKLFAIFGYESILNRLRANLSTQTVSLIRQEAEQFIASFSSERREDVNRAYTFLMYMKNLVFYEFDWLLKRFDPSYTVGAEAHFGDIPVDALLAYFTSLEEALMQIDLQLDFHLPLDALFFVYQQVFFAREEENDEYEQFKTTFSSQVDALKGVIQEFMYKNYLTLLIRVVKKNPSYFPSFVHIRFDLVQKYTEIMSKRLKIMIEKAMRQVKFEKVEKTVHEYFPHITPVGVYTPDHSKELEHLGLPPFTHSYALAILIHFFAVYYKEWLQPVLNVVMMNGLFADEYFRRGISDIFYSADKFQMKIQDFVNSLQREGEQGMKFLSLMKKIEGSERKKSLEKQILFLNSSAGDLFQEFYSHFLSLKDIMAKLYQDLTSSFPRYVRNIHSVGGARHSLYKEQLKKSYEFLQSFEGILQMLREMPS